MVADVGPVRAKEDVHAVARMFMGEGGVSDIELHEEGPAEVVVQAQVVPGLLGDVDDVAEVVVEDLPKLAATRER